MLSRTCGNEACRGSALILSLALSFGWPSVGMAEDLPGSLSLAPAGVDYYAAAFRNGERLQRILKSNAWARLNAIPLVKIIREQALGELSSSGELSEYGEWFNSPNVQELFALAGDALSREVFLYAGDDFSEALREWRRIEGEEAPLRIKFSKHVTIDGTGSSEQVSRTQTADWTRLAKHVDKLRLPGVILGCKVSDRGAVEVQLQRLEAWLRGVLAESIPVDRLKWAMVDGERFLSLELDGSLVPWDEFEPQEEDANDEDRRKAIAGLKRMTLVLSLGLRGDYLIAAVGPSRKLLEGLGDEPRLSGRKELAPLRRAAGQRLVDVEYRSRRLQAALAGRKDGSQSSSEIVTQLLSLAGNLSGLNIDADVISRLGADLERLAKDSQAKAPDPEATVYFSFLIERGIESATYDYARNRRQDGTQPLRLLAHVGPDPLLFSIQRRRSLDADYRRIASYAKTWFAFAEGLVHSNVDESGREHYEQFSKPVKQLLHAADDATRNSLLPALADGELGFLVEKEIGAKRADEDAPENETETSLWLPALIAGVSDRPKLDQALRQYRAAGKEFLESLLQLKSETLPGELRLPAAETKQTAAGVFYQCDLSPALELDARIQPTLGLGEKALALTLTPSQAERILAENRWRPRVGPLVNRIEKPIYSATYVNYARLMDAAQPWLEFALLNFPAGMFDNILGPFGPTVIRPGQQPTIGDALGGPIIIIPEQSDEEKAEEYRIILEQFRGFLEVLHVLRTVSTVCYEEDGAVVTRRLIEIQDLPAADAKKSATHHPRGSHATQ